MNLEPNFHPLTRASLDAEKARNGMLQMPQEGRHFYIHATIEPSSIPYADSEDLLVPGLYKVFVPETLEECLAARCAFEAFHRAVPVSCLDTVEIAVIHPETGLEVVPDFGQSDFEDIAAQCLGLAQCVASTYSLSPLPFPVANLLY
jgi:hypothetical protein